MIPRGVPWLRSKARGVEEDPEDSESLVALWLPWRDVIVLLPILKMLLEPLKRRSAEKALLLVPTDESVFMERGREALDR